MALEFKSLRELVNWLADKHHAGAVYPMAKRTGLSPATMEKWSEGNVKNPEIASLYLLADAYQLSRSDVIEVAMRAPSKRRGRRALACLVAALLGVTAWGRVDAWPTTGWSLPLDRAASYRKWLVTRWRKLTRMVSPGVGLSPIVPRKSSEVYRYVAVA